jgi:hypothetical protein
LNHTEIKHEVDFLRSADNPFPSYFTKMKFSTITKQFLKRIAKYTNDLPTHHHFDKNTCSSLKKYTCKGMCVWSDNDNSCKIKVPKQFADLLESKLATVLLSSKHINQEKIDMSQYRKNNKVSELTFHQGDVTSGKIQKLQDALRDPYMYIDRVIDDYVKNIITSEVKIKPVTTIKNILTKEWRDLPVKFNIKINGYQNFRINEKHSGFGINTNDLLQKDFITKLFHIISKMTNSKIKINTETVKKLTTNRLIHDYNYHQSHDDLDKFISYLKQSNSAIKSLTKKLTSITLQDIVDIFNSPKYVMSEYELLVLANLLKIKIVIIARKGVRNPNEIKCIKPYRTTTQFIMLFQKEHENFDTYELIVRNTDEPKFIFNDNEKIYVKGNETLSEYIKSVCVKYYVFDDPDIKENNS